MKAFVGIDVGKNGGIAIIDSKGKLIFTSTIPKIKKEIDIQALHRIFNIFKTYSKGDHQDNVFVVFENLHSIFGVGAKANFEFGRANGFIEMATVSFGYRYLKTSPKDWQKVCWEGIPIQSNPTDKFDKNNNRKFKVDTKATSLLACKRLFPNAEINVTEIGNKSKNEHDGIVDAILLAYYSYLKFK